MIPLTRHIPRPDYEKETRPVVSKPKVETWGKEKIEAYLKEKYDMRPPTDRYGQPIKGHIINRIEF